MRHYEMMIIIDPQLDERTVAPSLDQWLGVVKTQGGSVDKVDVWGKRRLCYEIDKRTEGIYAVVDMSCTPATVAELDRHLSLSESVLRTKVLRRDQRKG
jgi:small subunit ribosomal protein S6